MTSYFHAAAALILAGYLYRVWNAGQTGTLYDSVKTDLPGYAKWGAAAAVLLWFLGRTGEVGMSIGTLAIVAAGLNKRVGPRILQGVESIVSED